MYIPDTYQDKHRKHQKKDQGDSDKSEDKTRSRIHHYFQRARRQIRGMNIGIVALY